MISLKVFEDMIETKLMALHTTYLAEVLSVSGNTAKIQPLGMTKIYGQKAQAQPPLTNIPITKEARENVRVGSIVVCTCCERDITEAKKGRNSVPAIGHHSQSDTIIIGTL